MKKLALVALALVLGLALLVAAGCGGKVPQGAIATVGGVPITQAQFDQYINQAKASAGQNGQPAFPSPGTTTYNRYAAEIVNYLVEQQVVLNAAAKRRRSRSPTPRCRPSSSRSPPSTAARRRCTPPPRRPAWTPRSSRPTSRTRCSARSSTRRSSASRRPPRRRCRPTTRPTRRTFDQPATRTVRHVLVKTKAEALKVRALLAANNTTANWAKVAKKYSIDTGTKNSGGSLGAITARPDGQAVRRRRLLAQARHRSRRRSTRQYGWHVHRGHQDHAGQEVHLRERQGEHQEHADQPDAAARPGQAWLAKAQKARRPSSTRRATTPTR